MARGVALAALLAASLAVPAQATTPSGTPDVQQPVHQVQFDHVMGFVAQTFTAPKAGALADIQLFTATQGIAQISVLLYATDPISGAPTGDPLGTSGNPRTLSAGGTWQDFSMATSTGGPVLLTAQTKYAIVVPIWSTSVFWWYASGNLYPGGQIWLKMCFSCSWVSGQQGFVNYALLDFAFKVWISAVTTDSTPSLNEASPQEPVTEGTAPTMTGTFFDPGGDAVTVNSDHGTVTAPAASSGTWSWTEPPMDDPTVQTVTVTATDTQHLSTSMRTPRRACSPSFAIRISRRATSSFFITPQRARRISTSTRSR